jgi:tetratricopeptide (TPR) repeat protein
VILPLALLLAAAAPAATGPADTRSPQERFDACLHLSDVNPAAAEKVAADWARTGGGVAAAQCLGIARSALGDWKGATDAFTTAASLADQIHVSSAPNLWVSAGDAALAGGDAATARKALSTAIAAPDLPDQMKGEAYLDRARADVAAEDLGAARGDLDVALKLVPDDPVAWLLSATLARRMNDQARAATDIKGAETRAPNAPEVFFEAGNIAAAGGDMADARTQWSHAIAVAPDSDIAQQAQAELATTGGNSAAKPTAGH